MFRILFALLMIGSVFFTIYNPALPGLFLVLVELMFLLVAGLLYLRLKKGVKIHFREEAQGFAVRVENHSNVPLVRMQLQGNIKKKWNDDLSSLKLMLQADAQSAETFTIQANRLSQEDDIPEGAVPFGTPGEETELLFSAPVGQSILFARQIVFAEPMGLFSKTIHIGRKIMIHQFPNWVEVKIPDPYEDSRPVVLKVDLRVDDPERLTNNHLEVFFCALLSFGLAAVNSDREVYWVLQNSAPKKLSNEEEIYLAVRDVMDSELITGQSAPDNNPTSVQVSTRPDNFDQTTAQIILFDLSPAIWVDGKEHQLSTKNIKVLTKELQEI